MATADCSIRVEITLKLSPKEAAFLWGITQNRSTNPVASEEMFRQEEQAREEVWKALQGCKRDWENR